MILKEIFSKQNFITKDFLQNKLLCKNEYNKIYIRNHLKDQSNTYVLENNSSFDIFNKKDNNNNFKIGNSIASNPFLLKNQNNKTMQLNTFFTKTTKNVFLKNIYKSYKFLTTKKKEKLLLF